MWRNTCGDFLPGTSISVSESFTTLYIYVVHFIPLAVYRNLANESILIYIISVIIILVAAIFVLLVKKGVLTSEMSYRFGRIEAWLNPEAFSSTTGFQTLQALYAIGSGELFGKGLGQSIQKLGFIPEAQNDMVFSIICEELGLFGASAVLLMFFLMIWRFFVVANNTFGYVWVVISYFGLFYLYQ